MGHRIKITSDRRATQRYNAFSFFNAKICSLLARTRRSSQPVQRFYWPENVIDLLEKWRSTCVMRDDRNFKASDLSGPSVWIFILCMETVVRMNATFEMSAISSDACLWIEVLLYI